MDKVRSPYLLMRGDVIKREGLWSQSEGFGEYLVSSGYFFGIEGIMIQSLSLRDVFKSFIVVAQNCQQLGSKPTTYS